MLTRRRPATRRHLVWWALAAVPVAFLALFFVWPLAAMVGRGLVDSGGNPDLAGAAAVLGEARTWTVVRSTLTLALTGTAGSLALGLPAAYVLYRLRWRGQQVVRALVAVPFVLPTVVVAAAFTALLGSQGIGGGLGLDQSVLAIVLALVFFNVTVVVRIVGATWAGLDPAAVAAARTLGASPRRAFRHVTLPALLPAMGSAAAVVFLFCSTAFGVVLVLGGTRVRTVETEIYLQVNQFLDLRAAAVLSVLQMAFVGVALGAAAWARRRRERTSAAHRIDGSRAATRRDVPLIAGVLMALGLLLATPMLALLERSLRTSAGHGLDHYAALLEQPQRTVLAVPIWQAGVNSLVTATVAATIASTLGLIVAHLMAHRTRRSAALDTL
ncbi:MAG: ABC transporter permease subunit, partial [Demequina sp.]